MAFVTGARSLVALKKQADFVTAATGNYQLAWVTGVDLRPQQEIYENDVLGTGRDDQRPERGPTDYVGTITVPLCRRGIGHWLSAAFGDPVTSGTGPYTHVFKSGQNAINHLSIEQQHPDASGGAVYIHTVGVCVEAVRLAWSAQGRAALAFEVHAKSQTKGAASNAGTPSAAHALGRLTNSQGIVKKDGSALGRVLSWNLTYGNSIERDRYANGNGEVGDIGLGRASARGDLTARFADLSLVTLGDNATVFDLVLGWEESASAKLLFELEQAELGKAGPALNGPGGLQTTFPLIGSKDSAEGQMLTVTLINDVASYA